MQYVAVSLTVISLTSLRDLFQDCLLWHSLECKGYFKIAVVGSSYSCQ